MIKIAVASGKGGTGKTFVSTNLYETMVEAGLHVGVVDCDAEVPNDALFLKGRLLQQWPVHVFCPTIDVDKCTGCGLCAEACTFHAITCIPSVGYIKVMDDLCHACTACLSVCPADAVISGRKEVGQVSVYGEEGRPILFEARLNEGEHSPVTVIREAIRRAQNSGWDYLILDAPPGCACPFVNTVKEADFVFLVTEPTPFGLSDLKHSVQVLRYLNKPFSVLINRSNMGDGNLKAYLQSQNIEILAEFPYSESIAASYSKGDLSVCVDSYISGAFKEIIEKIFTR